MKKWEELEFEMQQQSIRKWAETKFHKILEGRLLKRKLRKLQRLAAFATGDNRVVVEISVRDGSVQFQYGYGIDKTYRSGSVQLK